MELQELVERIQRWKARIAAEEAGKIDIQPDDIIADESMDESEVLVADAVVQADDIEEESVAEEMYEEETAAVDEEEPQVDEEVNQTDEEVLQADEEEIQADEEALQADEEGIDIDVDVNVESEEAAPDRTSEINIDDVEEI
jgi:hypothetical protein